jgi:glutathione S-transferase
MTTNYTLVLGTKNYSSWSLRPWLAMKMAGIAFDETVITLRMPETKERIAQHSPSGKVPVLHIDEQGKRRTVWDTLAICEYLAERHADKALWPMDALRREEARAVVAEMHSGFANVRRTMPMDLAAQLPTPEIDDELGAEIERIKSLWVSLLKRFGKEGGFLFGAFTLADCFYAPVVTRFETYAIGLPTLAQDYAQRILSLAPMREWRDAAIKEQSKITAASEPEAKD